MIHFSLANKVASGCQIPLPRTATWHALWSFGIKILQGEKPADIPVEQPGKFELAINLRTAKALDLRIAEAFLIRADRASTDAADFRCWPLTTGRFPAINCRSSEADMLGTMSLPATAPLTRNQT